VSRAAENIDERGFSRTGGAHERDPFAGVHIEADAAEAHASVPYCLIKSSMTTLLRRDLRRRWSEGTHASPLKNRCRADARQPPQRIRAQDGNDYR